MPNNVKIIRKIKSRMWSVDHVTCKAEMRNAYKILDKQPNSERPLGRSGIDRRIIRKWMLKK
jgi:hypothetical protein